MTIGCQNTEKGPQSKSVENAPFEASADIKNTTTRVLSRDSEGNPIQVLFTAEGSGEMTHLGKVKVYREGGRNETNGTEVVRIIFIDSKGDSLFMGSRASIAADGSFTSSEQISGGSGRYANATGNATSSGQKQGSGDSSWKQSGTITY